MCPVPVIAIVDDDEAVRVATGSLVRSLGYKAQTYASAKEFLEACVEQEPACLITDVQMPDMDGIELHRALRAQGRRFPVIFVTAFPTPALRERALAAGASAFLRKPFDCEVVVCCLRKAVADSVTD